MKKYSVVIADDHPVVLFGVQAILENETHIEITNVAHNSTELFKALETQPVDVVVTDFSMPGGAYGDGIDMLTRLHARFPDTRVIVLTIHDNPALLANITRLPIAGILSKTGEIKEIPAAIERVMAGGRYLGASVQSVLENADLPSSPHNQVSLSNRELEVLRMFLGGMSVMNIATTTHRSIKTISNQKQSAMRKLGCSTDSELFKLKQLNGLGGILPEAQV